MDDEQGGALYPELIRLLTWSLEAQCGVSKTTTTTTTAPITTTTTTTPYSHPLDKQTASIPLRFFYEKIRRRRRK